LSGKTIPDIVRLFRNTSRIPTIKIRIDIKKLVKTRCIIVPMVIGVIEENDPIKITTGF
jgi:hypothetical protein